jgi:hypothetical protein
MVTMMKKTITLFLLLCMGAVTAAQAQHLRQGAGGAESFILHYGEELNLSDEQKEQIISLAVERRNEVRQSMARNGHSRGEWGGRADRQQRGAMRGHSPERERGAERFQRGRGGFYDILTGEQQTRLKELRIEEVQKRHRLGTLRNKAMVERAGIEGEKSETVLGILNRRSELQASLRVQMIEQPGAGNREAARDMRQEIREGKQQLKHLLTAAEYEKLRGSMHGQPLQRRMMRRGR